MLKTEILRVEDVEKDGEKIKKAAAILANGGLVVFPTETVYGLGANALDQNAVPNIFAAKGRPSDNPLIVHIAKLDTLYDLVLEVPRKALQLAEAFWPGALTIILKKKDIVPKVTSGGLDTVAVRMPSNAIAKQLILQAGVPVAAPSANLSGKPSPTLAKHCIEDLTGKVDAIIDGGECRYGVESTVISLAGETPVLLRPGAVTLEQMQQVIGKIQVHPGVIAYVDNGEKAISPGMKYRHYAPKAKVVIVDADLKQFVAFVNASKEEGVFALCFTEEANLLKKPFISYGKSDDQLAHAKKLFGALREFDERGAKIVYAHCPSEGGVGLAVYNRLLRAASFEVIKL